MTTPTTPTTPQKVVAVTGSSGHIGTKLLEHLEETPGLGKLVAFDVRPLGAPVHNIAAYRKDVAQSIQEELARHRVTTLVHLGFQWESRLKRRDASVMSERNAAMVQSVIESCREAGVQHLIYISSHSVYGAMPGLPLPVNEERPRNPAAGFPYAVDNYNAEQALLELAEGSPEIKVTIFRSCPALGTMTSMAWLRELYFPGWLGLSDHNPPLQFISDDDLARILCRAITEQLAGVYNVAANGVVFLRELAEALLARRIQLPASIVYPLKRLTGGALVAYSHYLDRWPVIMSTAKLNRATGYRYRHSALDAVESLVSYNREFQERLPTLMEVR